MKVHNFIIENYPRSIREPIFNGKNLPNKYITPCADGLFQNFYYWDTYFINVGLLAIGDIEMARNNLNIMKHFVEKNGFIPNADHLLGGSQPPLFTRGVFDLYQTTKDISDIKNYIYSCEKELMYWDKNRNTEINLNQYKCAWTEEDCKNNFGYFVDRVNGFNEAEAKEDELFMMQNYYAIAESGWDMTLRFISKGNRFAIHKYACLDLNCILYDAELSLSKMFEIIGENEKSNIYLNKALLRKDLINKYLLGDENIYLDYNFIDNEHSSVISVASLYPYAVGISKDKESCLKVFNLLKEKFGICGSINIPGEEMMQWDYPNMWAPLVYFAYKALKNVGLNNEAKWLNETYRSTVDKVFDKTGKLWEKYNALTGKVAVSFEYETPTMLGWTAFIYEFLLKEGE